MDKKKVLEKAYFRKPGLRKEQNEMATLIKGRVSGVKMALESCREKFQSNRTNMLRHSINAYSSNQS